MLRLRNQEFPDVFRAICSVLERDEISETYLAEFLEIAKAKKDELGLLKNMKMKHPITKTIGNLTRDRYDYLLSFRGRITNGLRSPLEAEREGAEVLAMWLDRYRAYFKLPRTSEQNTLVGQMEDDLDTNSTLSAALEDLGLTAIFNSIKLTTDEIELSFDMRSKDKEAQRIMARDVRNEAYEAMKRLINALDMAIEQNNENSEKYIGYWNEIGEILNMFNAKVQFRSTWHKRAAEKKNEQPIEGDVEVEDGDDVPEGNVEPTRTTQKSTSVMRSRPYSVVRLNEHMDDDLQKFEKENESWISTNDAMKNSVTNEDVSTSDDGNTAQADDAKTDNGATNNSAAGNGELTDDAQKTRETESGTTGHSDAKDSSDQESND